MHFAQRERFLIVHRFEQIVSFRLEEIVQLRPNALAIIHQQDGGNTAWFGAPVDQQRFRGSEAAAVRTGIRAMSRGPEIYPACSVTMP